MNFRATFKVGVGVDLDIQRYLANTNIKLGAGKIDGSVEKNTCCPSSAPEFSPHTHVR